MASRLLVLKDRVQSIAPEVSLDDLILGGFANSLAMMDSLGLGSKRTVELQEGLSIEIDIPLGAAVEWPHYLTELACMVDALSVDNAPKASRKLMLASGWVFGKHTLKSPAWMQPHVELAYDQLVAHGFDWAVPDLSDRR